jgi:hypothetical protein
MNKFALFLCIGAVLLGTWSTARSENVPASVSADLEAHRPQIDQSRLPAALRGVPLERLSSGALWRLDRDGDIVRPSAAAEATANTDAVEQTQAVTLDPRVSANIRLGDDPPQLPQNFRAQAEPHIIRAPTDDNFLLATFQEGRFTGGGAVTCGYSVSRDGGFTWTAALIPNLATINGGTYDRATDPVAGVALNGAAYLNTLGLRNGSVSDGTILVSRSNNGGDNWFAPVIAYKPPNLNFFPDKNWMAINTHPGSPNAGRMVVTFTLFSNTGGLSHPIMRVLSDDGGHHLERGGACSFHEHPGAGLATCLSPRMGSSRSSTGTSITRTTSRTTFWRSSPRRMAEAFSPRNGSSRRWPPTTIPPFVTVRSSPRDRRQDDEHHLCRLPGGA